MFSIIIIMIFFSLNSVVSSNNNTTKAVNQLNINLDYGDNDTIILLYNITTNYSYLITFRSFGEKQLKFGLFLPTYKTKEYSIEISQIYDTKELFHLFIICFHFILKKSNDLDIQCKDIHLLKKDQIKSNNISKEFLPSYNPLFVPMMYALSVIMLLPVIIQHHRRKTAQVKQRRKQLRRLSVTIAQDDQNPQQSFAKTILTHIVENGDINYGKIPTDIELLPMSLTKPMHDDMDDNVTFTLQNLPPFVHIYNENYIDDEAGVNADDCVAHLLNNTPWNTPNTDQPILTRLSNQPVLHDRARTMKEQNVSTIISFQDDDCDDDRKPILKSTKYSKVNFYRTNRAFLESDV